MLTVFGRIFERLGKHLGKVWGGYPSWGWGGSPAENGCEVEFLRKAVLQGGGEFFYGKQCNVTTTSREHCSWLSCRRY